MSLSEQDLQKYVGQNVDNAQQELENQGYKVHLVSTGRFATGYVPPKKLHMDADGTVTQDKRAIISFNGDDPERKITSIRQD
ncbi:unnamed protein product [Rotaria sp. Silwood1]|nr:unnamed protein product [Rotaria sp. Silwood1]CAF1243096.1 unnamed protein product [Rotaria sp. Silwood1]CAF1245826.1 unnamed protein product [Rotaria sp. Silwood1]CAF3468671.1 unnamed protein product [Rotaria sp. Silwood1]CAF3506432.1 unnamed protein product [Rotaria sp. Silwood1]